MTEILGNIALGDIGLAGLVTLVVIMILTGKLVPRSALDNERANTEAWRATAERQQEINRVQHDTNSELLTLARADHHALQEIQGVTRRAREEEASPSS